VEVGRGRRQCGLGLPHPADVVEMNGHDLAGHNRWQVPCTGHADTAAVTGGEFIPFPPDLDHRAVEQDPPVLHRGIGHRAPSLTQAGSPGVQPCGA
jgi:hypothetical protein